MTRPTFSTNRSKRLAKLDEAWYVLAGSWVLASKSKKSLNGSPRSQTPSQVASMLQQHLGRDADHAWVGYS
jgi:hypothetical protein